MNTYGKKKKNERNGSRKCKGLNEEKVFKLFQLDPRI